MSTAIEERVESSTRPNEQFMWQPRGSELSDEHWTHELIHALSPTHSAQQAKALRLDLQWNVEVLEDGVHSEWES